MWQDNWQEGVRCVKKKNDTLYLNFFSGLGSSSNETLGPKISRKKKAGNILKCYIKHLTGGFII